MKSESYPISERRATSPFAFKYYDPDEVICGKPMREHLKFAMSYWHTINASGTDMFGGDTMDKSFGKTDPMEKYKAKARLCLRADGQAEHRLLLLP